MAILVFFSQFIYQSCMRHKSSKGGWGDYSGFEEGGNLRSLSLSLNLGVFKVTALSKILKIKEFKIE